MENNLLNYNFAFINEISTIGSFLEQIKNHFQAVFETHLHFIGQK